MTVLDIRKHAYLTRAAYLMTDPVRSHREPPTQ